MLSMTDGKELASFRYDDLKYKGNGMIAYKEDSRWGLMDATGTPLTEPLYKASETRKTTAFPQRQKTAGCILTMQAKSNYL